MKKVKVETLQPSFPYVGTSSEPLAIITQENAVITEVKLPCVVQ